MKLTTKEIILFLMLAVILLFQIFGNSNKAPRKDYFKTTADVEILKSNYKVIQLMLNKQKLKTKQYEDSLFQINKTVSIYLANPKRSTLDSLRAIYNPK